MLIHKCTTNTKQLFVNSTFPLQGKRDLTMKPKVEHIKTLNFIFTNRCYQEKQGAFLASLVNSAHRWAHWGGKENLEMLNKTELFYPPSPTTIGQANKQTNKQTNKQLCPRLTCS